MSIASPPTTLTTTVEATPGKRTRPLMFPHAFRELMTVAHSGRSVNICWMNVRLIRGGWCNKTNSSSRWPSWKQKRKGEPQIRFWNSDQYINYSPGQRQPTKALICCSFSFGTGGYTCLGKSGILKISLGIWRKHQEFLEPWPWPPK